MRRIAMLAATLMFAFGCSSAAEGVRVLEREPASWTIPGDDGATRTLDVVVLRVQTPNPPASLQHRLHILVARDPESGLTYRGSSVDARQWVGTERLLRQIENSVRVAEHDGRLYEFSLFDGVSVNEISRRTASIAEAEREALQWAATLAPRPALETGDRHVPFVLVREFTDTGGAMGALVVLRDAAFRDGAWRITLEGTKNQRAIVSIDEQWKLLGIRYETAEEGKQQQ